MAEVTCHPHDRTFVEDRLAMLPERFRPAVVAVYVRRYMEEGRRPANLFLIGVVDDADAESYRLAADDNELVETARAAARKVADRWGGLACWAVAMRYARKKGVEPPSVLEHGPAGVLARLQDERWWRRAYRVAHGRRVETVARRIGLVHKEAGCYSSDETLYRRQQQKTRNRRLLQEVVAVNELGEEFTLEELAAVSVSNPELRRLELMTRIAGMEAVAMEEGHGGEFITLTCPSRFHPYTLKKVGGRWRAFVNPSYDGSTPREAQDYLRRVWARIRAALHRREIFPYGFRVAEPHHDGTPHWHFLLFLPEHQREALRGLFLRYGLEDSPDEPGALKHRVTFLKMEMDGRRTATGYVAKYVAKNIDGHGIDADLYGNPADDAAARVDAWACCWGIRQFQQIGGPSVTVWRELRRLDHELDGVAEAARAAADAGDWAGFVRAMGGPICNRKERPLSLFYLQDVDTETGEIKANRYGELPAGAVVGIEGPAGEIIVTRFHQWSIERRPKERKAKAKCGTVADWPGLLPASGAAVSPWSSVNNCTPGEGWEPPPGTNPPGENHEPGPWWPPDMAKRGA